MLFLTLAIVVGLQQPAAEWVEPSGIYAEQVKDVLTGQEPSDEQAWRELLSLGEGVVPTVEAYLTHPDFDVRSRAARLILRISPDTSEVLSRLLRCPHTNVQFAGLSAAVKKLENEDIAMAMADMISSAPDDGVLLRESGTALIEVEHGPVPLKTRQHIISAIRSRWTNAAEMPIEGSMFVHRQLTRIMGSVGERGDAILIALCTSLESRTRQYDFEKMKVGRDPNWAYLQGSKRDRLLESLFIARVRLEDPIAIDRFVEETESGPREIRQQRFRQLRYLEADEELVRMAVRLLDDEAEIINAAPSHSQFKYYHRACDLAAAALAHWYEDCPLELRQARVLSPEELQSVKDWAGLKLNS